MISPHQSTSLTASPEGEAETRHAVCFDVGEAEILVQKCY